MRVYRLLLRLFPTHFRDEFGPDMEALFGEQRRRVRGFAVVRFWIAIVIDILWHALAERLSSKRHNESRWWMDLFRHDVRYAVRLLLRQPATTAATVLTLALGIGANTAVFSVVHAVMLRSLPYAEPHRLVMVWEKRPAEGVMDNVVSPADYLDWAAMNQSFSSMAAFSEATADLTGEGEPVQLVVGGVTAHFFNVLGILPLIGRTFNPEEDVLGQHRVVVLSHALWQARFGGRPDIVGRTITLNGVTQQVIGVLPPSFESPTVSKPVLWAPLVLGGGKEPPPRALHFLNVFARLKPGASVDAARSEMDAIGKQLETAHPDTSRGHGAHLVSLRDEIVQPVREGLIVLSVAVAFILLIACVNVTNLLLARSASRQGELAVRAAVGAARSRLVRQSLTESVVLAATGGVVGIAVAAGGLQLLVTETPPALRGVGLERATLNPPVLVFTIGLCLMAGLIAGLLPAWQLAREDLNGPLRGASRSRSGLRKSARFGLIVAEVSLTSLLLIGAGLMLQSLRSALAEPAGFETANRLTASIAFPRTRYPNADAYRRAQREIETRFAAVPGIQAVGATSALPMSGADGRRGIQVDGYNRGESDPPTRAHPRVVTVGYFRAVGIHVAAGRAFMESDSATSPLVAVINETMARRYWRGRNPIGSRVRLVGEEPWREVVGVIKDVRHWGFDREVNPELYFPFRQQPTAMLSFVLHTTSNPASYVPELRRRVQDFDRDLPLASARTLEEVSARSVAARRWSATLLGLFALLALTLAGIGIYGVMSHLVSARTTEIGIRLALGAKRGALLRAIIGEGVLHSAIGLGVGLSIAFALMGGLRALLYGVTPHDPLTWTLTAATLLVVAATASFAPAFRAMRVDPVQALRSGQ